MDDDEFVKLDLANGKCDPKVEVDPNGTGESMRFRGSWEARATGDCKSFISNEGSGRNG